jgi:ribosomal-protein-alanine N-acetyltransferase
MAPEIETQRLLLRRFTLADADAYYNRIFGDPEVMRYLRGGREMTRADMESIISRINDRWAAQGMGFWAVTDRENGELIGHCGLKPLDTTTEVEIAYALAKSHWDRGLATEAARTVLRFGFEQRHLERIVAVAVPENLASRRVMEKLGMRYVKTDRYYDDDLVYYALSHADFQRFTR